MNKINLTVVKMYALATRKFGSIQPRWRQGGAAHSSSVIVFSLPRELYNNQSLTSYLFIDPRYKVRDISTSLLFLKTSWVWPKILCFQITYSSVCWKNNSPVLRADFAELLKKGTQKSPLAVLLAGFVV